MKYIMIIDDSVTIRAIAELVLKNLGYAIKHAENGKDALNKIWKMKANGDEVILCITDLSMPVMDGISFIRELKKTEKSTPVILLTSASDEKPLMNQEKSGASGLILKPFSPDELLKTVNKLIK